MSDLTFTTGLVPSISIESSKTENSAYAFDILGLILDNISFTLIVASESGAKVNLYVFIFALFAKSYFNA